MHTSTFCEQEAAQNADWEEENAQDNTRTCKFVGLHHVSAMAGGRENLSRDDDKLTTSDHLRLRLHHNVLGLLHWYSLSDLRRRVVRNGLRWVDTRLRRLIRSVQWRTTAGAERGVFRIAIKAAIIYKSRQSWASSRASRRTACSHFSFSEVEWQLK
ncbi:hypothetical protein AC1031_018334 [Aphanomyces cochlioides]|nr:hypothetical protein AC1031_018334 [Aphanomyces cochlioides]